MTNNEASQKEERTKKRSERILIGAAVLIAPILIYLIVSIVLGILNTQ